MPTGNHLNVPIFPTENDQQSGQDKPAECHLPHAVDFLAPPVLPTVPPCRSARIRDLMRQQHTKRPDDMCNGPDSVPEVRIDVIELPDDTVNGCFNSGNAVENVLSPVQHTGCPNDTANRCLETVLSPAAAVNHILRVSDLEPRILADMLK